ncbi:Retrotransposable element Tf2 protein [Rhizoctonia solani]|uniref:Retrotransposable element Tf2 protein n=1 Tax=Rhizoctonia solani TaxID=456999 RepID=A0A8H8SYK9_9AGAM|nr:Retrotransposable element Tf2 protein [Rhizoctonia solani]QRW22619.1 Retrotransposable element Tf2 protein [Rhizoctonia solani]
MSKSFSGAKANYDTHNKELLAIIKALEEWRIFLEATDRPIQKARALAIFLSNFNFEIHIAQESKPEIMLPAEVFANTNPRKTEGRPSLEPIIQFLSEDADNAPLSICKAYRDYNWRKIYSDSEILKERLLREFHDSPYRASWTTKNLELLSCNYWWPGMKSSAKEWVECCPTCQANCRAHAPVIALKPLEVPPFPFHTISYDFITGFPKSSGHTQSWW